MLKAYWFDLTEEARALAEDLLERAIKEAGLNRA
jgi:hypothetical protein